MSDNGSSGKKKKNALKLNAQDALLWKHVKKSITPLKHNSFEPHGDLDTEFSNMVGKVQKKRTHVPQKQAGSALSGSGKPASPQMPSYSPPISQPKQKRRRITPELSDFQRREARRIVTGHLPIDATLDLHGMTQRRAKPSLKRFLRKHQAMGDKVVLVITGKGNSSRARRRQEEEDIFYENQQEGGVLQYMVPNWLDEENFREMVISYKTAHRSHGEEGALYIRLRKFR